MIRLIQIQWIKLWAYKPFWVIGILYSVLVVGAFGSAMPIIDYVLSEAPEIGGIKVSFIPIYYFPDIWQNVTYAAGFLNFLPAFLLILMVCNEFSYKTMRQNIIDGMSRVEVVKSNVALAFIISLVFTTLIGALTLILGFIYSKSGVNPFEGADMLIGFFLQLFTLLMLAMLASVLIKRAGITIVLLFLYRGIEAIGLGVLTYYDLDLIADLLPFNAIANVISAPFQRYIFMEIQNYLSFKEVGIVLAQAGLYIWLIYLMLRKRNLV